MFTELEKQILFYALEAVQRSLYELNNGKIDYCDRLTLDKDFNATDLSYEDMNNIIDSILDRLC